MKIVDILFNTLKCILQYNIKRLSIKRLSYSLHQHTTRCKCTQRIKIRLQKKISLCQSVITHIDSHTSSKMLLGMLIEMLLVVAFIVFVCRW